MNNTSWVHHYLRHLPHRRAFMLAWPMMLGNISIPLMGLADAAMLAHLESANYVGAVAIGTNILTFIYWAFSFLRMGTTALVGQSFGANNYPLIKRHLSRQLIIASGIGGMIIVFQVITIPTALGLMTSDNTIRHLSETYITTRMLGAPAVLATYVIIGWFIGIQNTKIPLVIMVTTNIVNIGLDFLLIVIFDLNAFGAAIASISAEYLGLSIGLYCVFSSNKKLAKQFKAHITHSSAPIKQRIGPLLSQNTDLFIRTASLLFVFNFFTVQSGRLGADVLAANALMMQLALFIAFTIDGYAHAAEAMAARAIGGKNVIQFHQSNAATISIAFLIAIMLTVYLVFFGQATLQALTNLPHVLTHTHTYHLWLTLIPIVSIWCYLFDGIFIGAGKTRELRNGMLISVLFIFLPLWFYSQILGNHGLWLSFIAFNLARGLTLATSYRKLTNENAWVR